MDILEKAFEILGQIIGVFFAYHLLRLAYKLLARKRFFGAVFAAWASALLLLCSFPWFQVWAKSFIASNVTAQLTAFGQQILAVESSTKDLRDQMAASQANLDKGQLALAEVRSNVLNLATNLSALQVTAEELRNQLAGHQSAMDQRQQEMDALRGRVLDAEANFRRQQLMLTNQLVQVLATQWELATAETNVAAQGRKLSEIENLVRGFYGASTNDAARLQDTNLLR